MMNIYLLEDENIEFCGYIEFLIVANNEEEARKIASDKTANHMSSKREEVRRWLSSETSCKKIGNDENIYDSPTIITYNYYDEN